MAAVAHDPYVPEDEIVAAGATPLALGPLLQSSDIVSVHVRAAPGTDDMFGAEQFAAMREDALFINVARETVVDETALLQALDSGAIAGAGLDVIRPRTDGSPSPLLGRTDTVVLPHIGGATREAALNGVRILVDAMLELRQGGNPSAFLANGEPLAVRARAGRPR